MQEYDLLTLLQAFGLGALLLYGMKTMRQALESLGGGLLDRTLEKCTANDLSAVAFGTLITALVQSSAAVTVTVVGLVDAGMLKLRRAIGVILGANVGTCVTSWLISLTGLETDSLWLALLRADRLAALAAVAGVFLLGRQRQNQKALGQGLVGLALLLFCVHQLSLTLSPLAQRQEIKRLFLAFENPVLGIAIGTAVTALLQSSSASVGILQAISQSQGITVAAAIPIILGQNIGTTLTAMVASTGASLNAKRAAFLHFWINLLGAALFQLACVGLRALPWVAPSLLAPIDPAGIAWFHTLFNVVSTLVLIPFIGPLERLAMGIQKKKVST